MTLEQYLYFSILHKAYLNKSWAIRLFTVFKETTTDELYVGLLTREPYGFFVLMENGEKVKLNVTREQNQPLADKRDKIKIGHGQLSIVEEDSIETTIGRLFLNLITVYEPFQGRMPYINEKFSPKTVEKKIARKLKSTLKPGEVKKPGVYYVDELIRYSIAVTYIRELSTLFTQSITLPGLLPAPGRREFRQKLLDDMKARHVDMTNPIELANFEQACKNFDTAYLKENDPSYGLFMSGKVSNSRAKIYMTQGGETNSFVAGGKTVPITHSLDEGLQLDKETFTAAANTNRYGSYSRGAETVNGGVTAKAIMNAADTWKITEKDCGVNYGAVLKVTSDNAEEIIGMITIEKGQQSVIETKEQALAFLGKEIMIRSPQYCRSPGQTTCSKCAGAALSKYPEGQIIPLLGVSAGIMNDSLKKMHNTTIEKTAFNYTDVIT